MNALEKFNQLIHRRPHDHTSFWQRPAGVPWTRRQVFRLLGAGLPGCWCWPTRAFSQTVPITAGNVNTQNKARNCIFILLSGGPSQIDTFDFKMVEGVTPPDLAPESFNGLVFPRGILPRTAAQLPHLAIVRSVRAWAAVHSLAQIWTQIGRNPVSAFGKIAPHIGSIVALEKEPERTPSQIFPAFLALNVTNTPGAGYLPAQYAPFRINPSPEGLGNTSHPAGPARFTGRWTLLRELDAGLRRTSPLGKPAEDLDMFYASARALMYNPAVDQAFRYTAAASERYGNTSFGDACVVAQQVLAANQGTRFIQINLTGWDMHGDIYDRESPNSLYPLARTFDAGFASLLADLQASGLLRETLVVAAGEFGRTVGPLTGKKGRDHLLQQFVVFAGAGVRGGRALGATDRNGAYTVDAGWTRRREVRIEDVEATIYSALGINWTTIRYDDPSRRGFEYVPLSREDVYGPINELWG
jgi:hypothetical protein